MTCSNCKAVTKKDSVESKQIVFENFSKGCMSLVVGESIQRYEIKRKFWIKPGYRGINYKDPEIYRHPKLLVRKTGVGISASIDYQGSMTNQVVYIFKTKSGNEIPLEFYLGLLSSRAMYFYFAKTGGETEWRSHPYITQKKLLELPIPQTSALRELYWKEVQLIASLVKKCTRRQRSVTSSEDAAIEKALAKVFSLTKEDYEFIYRTIDKFEELLPVRALKKVGIDEIFND